MILVLSVVRLSLELLVPTFYKIILCYFGSFRPAMNYLGLGYLGLNFFEY